jgi:hypothetical protein
LSIMRTDPFMTVDEQILFWGAIVYLIMAIIACALIYLLYWCWKKRIAVILFLGKGREYSRDLQPVKYWSIMLYYTLAIFFILIMLCIRGSEWLKLLLKFYRNN